MGFLRHHFNETIGQKMAKLRPGMNNPSLLNACCMIPSRLGWSEFTVSGELGLKE
jgi:hypothetical protein